MRTKCRHPQKEKARHAGRRQRPHADPLVGRGDPPCRDTARATTDQTRPCHCVVALATSSPGRRTTSAHQTKRATVVLTRRRERKIRRFTPSGSAQRFLSCRAASLAGCEKTPPAVESAFWLRIKQ